jgi:hypothetical protein
MLAQSANLNAVGNWPTGVVACPFSPGTFAATYTGLAYCCAIFNGAFTTNPTPILLQGAGAAVAYAPDGANPPPCFTWTGQTDLPANGSNLTLNNGALAYWFALY